MFKTPITGFTAPILQNRTEMDGTFEFGENDWENYPSTEGLVSHCINCVGSASSARHAVL